MAGVVDSYLVIFNRNHVGLLSIVPFTSINSTETCFILCQIASGWFMQPHTGTELFRCLRFINVHGVHLVDLRVVCVGFASQLSRNDSFI